MFTLTDAVRSIMLLIGWVDCSGFVGFIGKRHEVN